MSLTLPPDDLDALAQLVRVLAAPFDPGSPADWAAAVSEELLGLLRADVAELALPIPGFERITTRAKPAHPEEEALTSWIAMQGRAAPRTSDTIASPYYKAFVAPNRPHDRIELIAPLQPAERSGAEAPARLEVFHTHPAGHVFSRRDVALMKVLLGAFTAGAQALGRWWGQHQRLLDSFEALGQSVAVVALQGRLERHTEPLKRLLAGSGQRDILETGMAQTAEELGRVLAAEPGSHREALTRRVETAQGAVTVRGCLTAPQDRRAPRWRSSPSSRTLQGCPPGTTSSSGSGSRAGRLKSPC